MENFDQLIKEEKLLLVDFFATWCGPCKAMHPVVDALKEELAGKVTIVKIDVDKYEALSDSYQIQMVPTFILFKDGVQVWRHSNVISKADLKNIILENI